MQQPKRQNTKTALIQAAERLFAEKGLGGVSVRDITRAAGARNESALHYYFGGMDALIREVFSHRYREIEKARMARLTEIDADPHSADVEALMEAGVDAMFRGCLEEEGRLYARFSVQLVTDPRFDVGELIRETGMESATAIGDRIFDLLSDMPRDVLATRLRRAFTISTLLVADYAGLVEAGEAPPVDEAISEASVSLSGYLRARPTSPPSS